MLSSRPNKSERDFGHYALDGDFMMLESRLLVGDAAVLFLSEVQLEKDFLKNYSVTKVDDCRILQEFWSEYWWETLVANTSDDSTIL